MDFRRAILRSGFRLLGKVAGNARFQLMGMLYHALRQSKNLARYIQNPFEIIADYRYLLAGSLRRVMDHLAAEGVYLLREERNGQYTYHLAFRDVVFRTGSWTEVKQGIREMWAEGKENLKGHLRRKYQRLRGSDFGLDYIEGTVETSLKIVRQEKESSCSAACVRQIGRDYGVYWSESKVRKILKTDKDGTWHEDIVEGVRMILDGKEGISIRFGTEVGDLSFGVNLLRKIYNENAKRITLIVGVAEEKGLEVEDWLSHTLIVDRVTDEVVYIRDPTDIDGGFGPRRPGALVNKDYGVEAQMYYHDFLLRWQEADYEYIMIQEL